MPLSREERYALAMTTAATVTIRAVNGDWAGVWSLADEIASGDNTRETVGAIAFLAAAFLGAVADTRREPVENVVGLVAGFAAITTSGGVD